MRRLKSLLHITIIIFAFLSAVGCQTEMRIEKFTAEASDTLKSGSLYYLKDADSWLHVTVTDSNGNKQTLQYGTYGITNLAIVDADHTSDFSDGVDNTTDNNRIFLNNGSSSVKFTLSYGVSSDDIGTYYYNNGDKLTCEVTVDFYKPAVSDIQLITLKSGVNVVFLSDKEAYAPAKLNSLDSHSKLTVTLTTGQTYDMSYYSNLWTVSTDGVVKAGQIAFVADFLGVKSDPVYLYVIDDTVSDDSSGDDSTAS